MGASIFEKLVSDKSILEKTNVIYLITNKLDLMKYVGKTTRKLKFRLYQHKNNPNSYIGRAIQKCGWENFRIEILEECKKTEQLNEREIYWIQALNTKAPNGYNLTDGGDGGKGYIPSAESNAKRAKNNPCKLAVRCVETGLIYESVAEAARQTKVRARCVHNVCNGIYNTAYGFHFEFVDEKRRLKAELKRPAPNKKPVRCVETAVEYESAAEAGRINGVKGTSINNVCSGRSKTLKGYHWEFVDEELKAQAELRKKNKQAQKSRSKKIYCQELNKTFESIAEAERQTGINQDSIGLAARGVHKTAGKMHWEFVQ